MHPVELVSTGNELLSGRTINQHASTLGEALRPIGLRLVRDTTVPDDIDLIAEAVASALRRVDLLVVSGGLGPTSDDITRDAIAKVLGRNVVPDPAALNALRARYAMLGRDVTPESERQALVVEGAEALLNPVGIAPGECIACEDGTTIYVLPGPPHEFAAVLRDHVVPRLRERFRDLAPPQERILMICGIGESDVAKRFSDAFLPPPGVGVAYCAAPGRLEIRVSAPAASGVLLDEVHGQMKDLLGDHVYAVEPVSIEETVLSLLADRGLTLATAEVGSAGALARALAAAPSGIGWYAAGLVANSNDVLIHELAVDPEMIELHGAASSPVARQMASAVRDRFRVDIGLSVTDRVASDPPTDERPEGRVFIGIDDGRECVLTPLRVPGAGAWSTEWLKQAALDRLRRRILRTGDGRGAGGS